MKNNTPTVLSISASGRRSGSLSRKLGDDLIGALEERYAGVTTTRRDLARGVPFVDDAWIDANFTAEEERSDPQRAALAGSDELVAEVRHADILVISVPIYNFSIPASLKAWIDMIARARVTFRYTERGPEGLLDGKKAYLIVTSGGVAVGSPADFATPYLLHALNFVGISDVEVIAADRLNKDADQSIDRARARIAELIHLTPQAVGL